MMSCLSKKLFVVLSFQCFLFPSKIWFKHSALSLPWELWQMRSKIRKRKNMYNPWKVLRDMSSSRMKIKRRTCVERFRIAHYTNWVFPFFRVFGFWFTFRKFPLRSFLPLSILINSIRLICNHINNHIKWQ